MSALDNKPIREVGMIISKKVTKAREAGETFDGTRKWDAKPEEYFLDIISCDEEDFNKDTGILNGTRLLYKVDKAVYEMAKFGGWANVKYTMSQFGKDKEVTYKPESCTLR